MYRTKAQQLDNSLIKIKFQSLKTFMIKYKSVLEIIIGVLTALSILSVIILPATFVSSCVEDLRNYNHIFNVTKSQVIEISEKVNLEVSCPDIRKREKLSYCKIYSWSNNYSTQRSLVGCNECNQCKTLELRWDFESNNGSGIQDLLTTANKLNCPTELVF